MIQIDSDIVFWFDKDHAWEKRLDHLVEHEHHLMPWNHYKIQCNCKILRHCHHQQRDFKQFLPIDLVIIFTPGDKPTFTHIMVISLTSSSFLNSHLFFICK